MESVKWQNVMNRRGFNLENLMYKRWISKDNTRMEWFTNNETGSMAILENGTNLTISKLPDGLLENGGLITVGEVSEVFEFKLERGTTLMDTVVHLLETYDIIRK